MAEQDPFAPQPNSEWPSDQKGKGSYDKFGFSDSQPWAGQGDPVVSFSKEENESSLLTSQKFEKLEQKQATSYGSIGKASSTNQQSIVSRNFRSVSGAAVGAASGGGGNSRSISRLKRFSSNVDSSEQITLTWEDIRVTIPAKTNYFRKSQSTPARPILKGGKSPCLIE